MLDKNSQKGFIFSGFWLKVIAILTMTLDHIGYAMQAYSVNLVLANAFRIVGRLALPLFCFLIYEGYNHTSNFKKYLIRLSILAGVVSVGFAIVSYVPFFQDQGIIIGRNGNIFIDLLLGLLAIKLLDNKNSYIKLLALLPLGYGIMCFVIAMMEVGNNTLIYWLPDFLRTQSGWYAITLIMGCYASKYLSSFIFQMNHLNRDDYQETSLQWLIDNGSIFLIILFITLFYFCFSLLLPNNYIYWDASKQNTAILSGALILLYNGKRGYNSKWFKYGSYIYYPLHLIIIYALFEILFL